MIKVSLRGKCDHVCNLHSTVNRSCNYEYFQIRILNLSHGKILSFTKFGRSVFQSWVPSPVWHLEINVTKGATAVATPEGMPERGPREPNGTYWKKYVPHRRR